jgi:hypothetical protein
MQSSSFSQFSCPTKRARFKSYCSASAGIILCLKCFLEHGVVDLVGNGDLGPIVKEAEEGLPPTRNQQ